MADDLGFEPINNGGTAVASPPNDLGFEPLSEHTGNDLGFEKIEDPKSSSATPETDRAVKDSETLYRERHHMQAEIPEHVTAFLQGAGLPTSMEGLKEAGKFLIRSPVQDVRDIYQAISELPGRLSNFKQTLKGSPADTVYNDPFSKEAFGVYGTAVGMLLPAAEKGYLKLKGAPEAPQEVGPPSTLETRMGETPVTVAEPVGGDLNAEQERETTPIYGDVQYAGGTPESTGEMPTDVSSEGVPPGRQGEVVGGEAQEPPQQITPEDTGDRPAYYRGGGESSPPKGKTAADIVNYETTELGNNITPAKGIDLKSIPSERTQWLSSTQKQAAEFGAVEPVVGNFRVLATDPDGGVLVEKLDTGARPVSTPETIKAPAVRWPDGKITTGVAHYDAAGGKSVPGDTDSGFLTSSGRFVFAKEAAQIALKSKQISDFPEGGKLDANDLSRVEEGKQLEEADTGAPPVGPTVGAASTEEYMQRYENLGASKIMEGQTELGRWSAEMLKENPAIPHEQLPQIFERSKQLLNDMQTAGRTTSDISREIKRQTGITRPTEEPVTVKPMAALKDMYAQIEKAGSEGYKRGQGEAFAQGRLGAAQIKKELQVADKWLSGDQEQVRQNMTEFVQKMLPPAERGRFIGAITRAMRRPPIGRDPGIMYRHAFNVFKAIENRAEDVYKAGVVEDIKGTIERASDAPGVDVGYRKQIKEIANNLLLRKPTGPTLKNLRGLQEFIDREKAAGRDPGIPQEHLNSLKILSQTPLRDMPLNALEELRDRLGTLEDLGRHKAKTMRQIWDNEKNKKIKELQAAPGIPMEQRPIFRPLPTETLTTAQKFGNHLNKVLNAKTNLESAIAPMDEAFDIMGGSKGTYDSWPSRHIKGAVDLDHIEEYNQWLDFDKRERELSKNLNKASMEKIGVKMVITRIGKERLEAMGIPTELIDKLDQDPFTPAEKAYVQGMRNDFAKAGPQVAELARQLYQQEVNIEPDYFPLEKDWGAVGKDYSPKSAVAEGDVPFNEKGTLNQLFRDMNPKMVSRTEQGFLKARIEGAKGAIRLNAQDIYRRHMGDVYHFLNNQRTLKMLGEITRSPEFKKKYGQLGQNITLDFLDTVATNGYVPGGSQLIDTIRKNLSKATVGYRLSSNLVHLSQIPYAMQHAGGPNWYRFGVMKLLSKDAQAFLKRYGGETYVRAGGEPAQKELSDRLSKAGFVGARMIDRNNAQAVLLGRYANEMVKRGHSLDSVFQVPLDRDAFSISLQRMRRAVASPLAKDVPAMTSRGRFLKDPGSKVTPNNMGRMVNQFRNIFLDNYSNFRHDFLRVGTQEEKEIWKMVKDGELAHGLKSQANLVARQAALGFAQMASIVMETGIKTAFSTRRAALLAAGLVGYDVTKELKKYYEDHSIEHDFLHHLVNRMPLVGPFMASIMYSETGVPAIDITSQVGREAYTAIVKAKKPETKARHYVRAATSAASLAGVPGSAQVMQIAEPTLSKAGSKLLPAYNPKKKGPGFADSKF